MDKYSVGQISQWPSGDFVLSIAITLEFLGLGPIVTSSKDKLLEGGNFKSLNI
jgi:hypothetical protein